MKETFALLIDLKSLAAEAMFLEEDLKGELNDDERAHKQAALQHILMAIECATKELQKQTKSHIRKADKGKSEESEKLLHNMTLRSATARNFRPISSTMHNLKF